MKATERRQALLELVCERRFDKVENLAFEFGVSERTIRNDVLELSLSYPISCKQGKFGGVYIEDDYYYGKTYLSTEQQELLEALKSNVTTDQVKVLQAIINKFGRHQTAKSIKGGRR